MMRIAVDHAWSRRPGAHFLLLLAADAQVMRCRYDHLMPTPQAEWPPYFGRDGAEQICLMVLKVSRDSRSDAESA
jgi:hypothetical protein